MGEIFVQEKSREVMPFTGERFTSAESGQIEIEHLHRYFLARHLCRGLDVLDVACGEGYGAALLAQVARSVVGVDTADDAVSHAADSYPRPNLSFRVGDACGLPLGDGTVDRVVSFETVEHFYDHPTFLREIRRVLRPDGLVIMSTPERDVYSPPGQGANPHHVHELTRREFYELMRGSFRHVRMFAQRPMVGSAIISDEAQPHAELPVVFENRGEDRTEASIGLPRGTYLLCIASDAELPPPPESLFIYTSDMARIFARREQLETLARVTRENDHLHDFTEKLLADNKILIAENERFARENAFTNKRNWDLQAARADERQRIEDQRGELNRLKYDIELERLQVARELDRVAGEIRQRDAALAEKHAAGQAELRRRDEVIHARDVEIARQPIEIARLEAAIDAVRRHGDEIHRHYFAEVQRLRRRTWRTELRGRRERQAAIARSAAVVRASKLFDAAWYLQANPDVGARGQDPAIHYAQSGADEVRDPGPDFSTIFYLRHYPDVISSGLNPLEHFELFGRAEGRLTRAEISDVAAAPAAEPALPLPVADPPVVVPPEAAAPAPAEPAASAAVVEEPAPAMGLAARLVFLSGEHRTAGHIYRVLRYAEAARELGCDVTVLNVAEAAELPRLVERADLVIIWRAEWDQAVDRVVDWCKAADIPILFDVDDLMFDPQLARTEVIDGIRSQALTEKQVQNFYTRIQQTLFAATYCASPTAFLTGQLKRWAKPAFVTPNGFDTAIWRRSRRAVRARVGAPEENVLRIGYAGGSRTHQHDFALVADALARVLREDATRRLVLFRLGKIDCLDLAEFPELLALEPQIEWREMVLLEELPWEMARFDINLAPLEVGNPFCESKSELKFFEAALVDVPTVASPTLAFREAIRDGVSGLLADGEEAWYQAIHLLATDPAQRHRMAASAYHDVLWRFGPDGRRDAMLSVIEQTLHRGRRAARALELDLARAQRTPYPVPHVPDSEVIVAFDTYAEAEVTVVIPLYNYAHYVTEALESVAVQTVQALDLVVVDDGSTDDSVDVVRAWIKENRKRFGRVVLRRNRQNSGLGFTRNVGFAAAETPFVMPLDADNRLIMHCLERCLPAITTTQAAFVYPSLQEFGDSFDVFSNEPYDPIKFAAGNFIDATALIRLSAWGAVGGYDHVAFGWEDYDLWCRFAERGMYGHHVDEVLVNYRVHRGSMLHTTTDGRANKQSLIADMQRRHGWILRNMGLER